MHATAFIRPCFEQDLEMVWLLAAHHALTGVAVLEEEALSLAEWTQRWSRIVRTGHLFLVACLQDDPSRVIGFAYTDAPLLGAQRLGQDAIELHGAVTPALLRHGIGGQLLREMLEELKSGQARHVYACYGRAQGATEPGPAAALLRSAHFSVAGTLAGAGRKFGQAIDVVIMSRRA